MNPAETHQPEKNRERNCIFYAMNESLFGQSYSQLQNMEQEMGIKLNIDFSHCYLILTGLPRRFYMERLGMRRSDLIEQVGPASGRGGPPGRLPGIFKRDDRAELRLLQAYPVGGLPQGGGGYSISGGASGGLSGDLLHPVWGP